ncbi:MAG: hypothetical protein IJU94_00055, partial [Clostridia bacterium]|nr:hypothetical protein [Clostridia bacterium]
MRAARHAKNGVKKLPRELFSLLFMPAAVLYLELFFRLYFVSAQSGGFFDFIGRFFGAGLWLSILFSVAAGIFFTLLCTFFKSKVNRRIALVILGILTVYFCVQAVYYHGFGTILKITLAADTGADAVTQFAGNAINYTFQMLWFIIFAFIPFAALFVFGRSWKAKRAHGETWHTLFDKPLVKFEKYPIPAKAVLAVAMVIIQLIPWALIMMTNKTTGLRAQYTSAFEHTLAAEKFGLITTARRELAIAIGGTKEVIILPEGDGSEGGSAQGSGGEGVVYAPNVMDIDFDALIASEKDSDVKKMHEYFKSRTPTKQNAYTGLFKGYNLVMITAEGFSPYAISKELTP